jgi:hypothetical protein
MYHSLGSLVETALLIQKITVNNYLQYNKKHFNNENSLGYFPENNFQVNDIIVFILFATVIDKACMLFYKNHNNINNLRYQSNSQINKL